MASVAILPASSLWLVRTLTSEAHIEATSVSDGPADAADEVAQSLAPLLPVESVGQIGPVGGPAPNAGPARPIRGMFVMSLVLLISGHQPTLLSFPVRFA
jgi:hypothetical protein